MSSIPSIEQRRIRAIAEGDQKAFEQLFREWYVRLCVYAESLLHDRDASEDLVQGVFCMLWEKRENLEHCGIISAYLYRSVYHGALNLLKHEKVRAAFLEFQKNQEEKEEGEIEFFMENENQQVLLAEIDRAIQALPEQCREIFLLSRFAGKKSTEIASQLNISVRTVETQLYRAMKKIREKLAGNIYLEIFFVFFCKKL